MADEKALGSYVVFKNKCIGGGNFGKVFEGVRRDSDIKFAIKEIEIPEDEEYDRKYLDGEVKALRSTKHGNIVKFYHAERSDKHLYIVLEYCIHGDLNHFIESTESLSGKLLIRFLQGSADAVNYLHSMTPSIVHRDIKPGNLLVQNKGIQIIKLTDFGLAKFMSDSRIYRNDMTTCGTQNYSAPETFPDKHGSVKYSISADVFSLGIVFLTLIDHEPGKKLQPLKVEGQPLGFWIWMKIYNSLPTPFPEICSPTDTRLQSDLKAVTAKMVVIDHKERPNMQHICDSIGDITVEHGLSTPQDWKYHILDESIVITAEDAESMPKHKLPLKEYHVNAEIKSRWCATLSEPHSLPEKTPRTLMMVGATGAGKSTLIDALVNYVLGVTWEDPFRFTIIDMNDDEKRNKGKDVCETQWITTYVIHPYPGSRVDYELRIVDMPGFGDTGGLTKDRQLVDRLRNFFSMSPQHGGLAEVDQVCFVVQAALTRLTAEQKYILYSIEALFDKSIKDNISAFITFADGKRPPVLKALKEADACVNEKHFVFNNSALFAVNESKSSYAGMAISKMFWDIGQDSCARVFAALVLMETKSLQLSKDVLDKRNQIEITVQKLRREVTKGLGNLDTLVQERQMLDRHAADVKRNKNFKYTVSETKYNRVKIPHGTYVTNCLMCNETCHYPCDVPNNRDKSRCSAMRNGKCTVCKKKCDWKDHRSDDHKYEIVVHTVERTYDASLKQKYEAALRCSSKQEDVVAALCTDFIKIQTEIHEMGKTITKLTNWLQKNALSQHPQSKIMEYYETMIQAEKRGRMPGYATRAIRLNDAIEHCKIIQCLTDAKFNPWQQYKNRPEFLNASALTKSKSKSAFATVISILQKCAF